VLRGQPATAVGRTDQVVGTITVDPANPASVEVGIIRINVGTLATDNRLRNRAIHRFILQSDRFEFAEFVPTAIDGLPDSVTIGEPLALTITGDLTVRDVTKPVTFETSVIPVSDTRLEGSAFGTIQRGDFSLTIPSVPSVADVSEEVRLEIDFVALAN
jgi:polyisoprenoid-binding protein YceI